MARWWVSQLQLRPCSYLHFVGNLCLSTSSMKIELLAICCFHCSLETLPHFLKRKALRNSLYYLLHHWILYPSSSSIDLLSCSIIINFVNHLKRGLLVPASCQKYLVLGSLPDVGQSHLDLAVPASQSNFCLLRCWNSKFFFYWLVLGQSFQVVNYQSVLVTYRLFSFFEAHRP
jgi:hypothetical protein